MSKITGQRLGALGGIMRLICIMSVFYLAGCEAEELPEFTNANISNPACLAFCLTDQEAQRADNSSGNFSSTDTMAPTVTGGTK